MPKTGKVQTAFLLLILFIFFLPLGSMTFFTLFSTRSAADFGFYRLALSGIVLDTPRPTFSIEDWLTHSLQDQLDKWFNKSFGARALFVKLGNQIYYDLFNKSYMQDQTIIIGKNSQLYSDGSIYNYCKLTPPMPLKHVEARVMELMEIQEGLHNRGVEFILLISPNKAGIYPEYIPDAFCESPKALSRDYESFIPLLEKHKINYVDGHTITLEAKNRESAPLFCQGGLHWNYLGAYHTSRRLTEMIGTLAQKPVGSLHIQTLNIDHKPTGSDKDLASLLNLAIPPYDYPAPHPVIITKQAFHQLGKAVVVGTSFNWILLDILNNARIFEGIDYYYYYKLTLETFPIRTSNPVDLSKVNWEKDIFNSHILVLEINEGGFQDNYIPAFLSDILQHLRANPRD
jgi:hypothetical protein